MSLLEAISTQWLLEQKTMDGLAGIVERQLMGTKVSVDEIAAVVGTRDAARAASRPWDSVLSSKTSAEQKAGFYMVGNVAVVPIEGVLAAKAGMVNNISSPSGMSSDEVIRCVTNAADAAAAVKGAMVLHMDSPGGTVAGTMEMARAIRAAAVKVPVVALANNQACSACYWIACEAHGIMGAPLSQVGSIGVMAAVPDTSQAAADAGVKINVVKRGKNKGIGTPGTAVTETQLAVIQAQLDVMYDEFLGAVKNGRGLTTEEALAIADGASHVVSSDASNSNPLIKNRLIDRVGNLNDAVAWAADLASNRTVRGPKRNSAMNLEQLKAQHPTLVDQIRAEATAAAKVEHDNAMKIAVDAAKLEGAKSEREKSPPAASIEEIESAVPATMTNRDSMVLGLVKSKATVAEAQAKVTAQIAADNVALSTKLAEVQKINDGLGKNGLATNPLTFKPSDGAKHGAFESVVLAIKERDKCDMQTAIGKACNDKDNSEARKDWVARGQPDIKAA